MGVRVGAWQRTGEEGEVTAIRIQITFIDAEFVLTDLFSLYVLFPSVRHVIIHCTLENCSIQFSCYLCVYVAVGIIYEKTKGQIPFKPSWGKQNIQVKEVSCYISSVKMSW